MSGILFLPAGDVAYLRVNKKIANISELVTAVCLACRYDGYCGDNLDALLDILRDLSWIQQKHSVLLHEDAIALSPGELESYFFVLEKSVEWWEGSGQRSFFVVLPDNLQEMYANFLKTQEGRLEREHY